MKLEVQVGVSNDSATPAVQDLQRKTALASVQRAVGPALANAVAEHVEALPTNKRGWPSTGFWDSSAKGVDWSPDTNGVRISVDNEKIPGAFRYQYAGGEIRMKDKLLTIPARSEFYGKRAGEWDNLQFGMNPKTGSKWLEIAQGGTGLVNFATGRARGFRGTGARAQAMIAYWLVESVSKEANPNVIPTDEQLAQAAIDAILELLGGNG